MRKLLAVWLSCLTMAGAAQAATIGGNFNVVAGVPETYTFNFDLLPGETFYSVKSFKVNSDYITPSAFSLASAGVGQLSFGRSFGMGENSLSVLAEIYIRTSGYFTCANGSVGSYAGECTTYKWVPGVDNVSPILFDATTRISVMAGKPSVEGIVPLATRTFAETAVVPIAGTLPLLLSGLGLLGWFARRRNMAAV